jgi:hypothetical protein
MAVENDRIDLLIVVKLSQGGLDRAGANHAGRLSALGQSGGHPALQPVVRGDRHDREGL